MCNQSLFSNRRLLTNMVAIAGMVIGASGFLALSTTAYGSDRIAVFTEQSYPLNYTESGRDDDPIIGFGTQLVKAVLEEAGLEYEITMVPWVRAIQAIDNRENVLVYSMTRNPERENRYHWIGEILSLEYYLFGLKERANSLPRSLPLAAGFEVGVVREDVVHRYLTGQGFDHLVVVKHPARNLSMLERGRIDLFPFSRFGVGLFSRRNGFDRDRLIGMVKLEEISTGIYMVLSKSTNDETVGRVRDAYARLKASGALQEIMAPIRILMEADRVDVIQ